MIFLGDFMKEKIRYFIYFIIIISIELFCSLTLNSMGIVTTVRRELGSDIDAACGQLRKKYIENSNKL